MLAPDSTAVAALPESRSSSGCAVDVVERTPPPLITGVVGEGTVLLLTLKLISVALDAKDVLCATRSWKRMSPDERVSGVDCGPVAPELGCPGALVDGDVEDEGLVVTRLDVDRGTMMGSRQFEAQHYNASFGPHGVWSRFSCFRREE